MLALPGDRGTHDAVRQRELARRRALARRRRKARIRRNRIVAASTVLVVVAVLFVGLSSSGSVRGTRVAAQGVARASLRPLLAAHVVVQGQPPSLPWPAQGEGAVAVRGVGLMGASRGERSVPIASLTKMMTAYVILRDHPIGIGASGPVVGITAADVTAYERAVQAGDSNVPVQVGERLSEHQLLEALLIPSADNVADLLGAWDAGSDAAFVARMNATARQLGLAQTHYADASGVNPGSRSTAADQARLAADLMALPVVREIVRNPSLPFPVAGTITNYNPALGVDGIVGVKSGFTSQAQGCLATAAYRDVGGRSVLVVTVALGQADGLYGAARSDERLLTAASAALRPVPVATAGSRAAVVTAAWSSTRTAARTPVAATAVGWPGLVLDRVLAPSPLRVGAHRAPGGVQVGTLSVRAPAGVVASVPLVAPASFPPVPAGWTPAGS